MGLIRHSGIGTWEQTDFPYWINAVNLSFSCFVCDVNYKIRLTTCTFNGCFCISEPSTFFQVLNKCKCYKSEYYLNIEQYKYNETRFLKLFSCLKNHLSFYSWRLNTAWKYINFAFLKITSDCVDLGFVFTSELSKKRKQTKTSI